MQVAAEHSESRRANFQALLRVADIPLLAALAVTIYFATAYTLVDRWHWLPMAHTRLLNSKEFVERRAADAHHDVYILGSSVTIDGIDCHLIDQQLAAGTESFSIDGVGSGPGRWPFIQPTLEKAQPAMVVLIVDLASAMTDVPMRRHQSAVAGWFDFLPRDSRASVEVLLNQESELEPLFESRLAQLFEFRVLPLVHLEVTLRETLRKDLRYEGYTTNFKDPWIRRGAVSDAARERSIQKFVALLKTYTVDDLKPTIGLVRRMADALREHDCPVMVVLAPLNPEVAKLLPPDYVSAMNATLAEGVRGAGAIYVDEVNLLPASGFSDHIHPFNEGRKQWSTAVGKAIRAAMQGGQQPHAVSDT